MRQIINGLIYDSKKANFLGRFLGDSYNISLFKTKNNRYFLFTMYNNDQTYFQPLEDFEASNWAENHLPTELTLKLFPEVFIDA